MEATFFLPYPLALFGFWDRGGKLSSDLATDDAAWLARFHAGEKSVLSDVYQSHFRSVHAAVARFLGDVDAETVTHEVFLKMVEDTEFRSKFAGGAMRAWLCTIARNRAIDTLRRRRREDLVSDEDLERAAGAAADDRFAEKMSAQKIVDSFRKTVLPEKWRAVFEARFMKQLSQREAAAELNMMRTTLAYQEMRVRALLERFVLEHREATQ